jgi:hypothetical protein
MAMPAAPSAASAEPPLKPYQPTHSIAAPVITRPGAWGGCTSRGKPRRGPNSRATMKAAVPQVT